MTVVARHAPRTSGLLSGKAAFDGRIATSTKYVVALDHWRRAANIRDEWLGVGLSTAAADRDTAESAITAIYARHRRARPTFVWVASPEEARPLVAGGPSLEDLHRWVMTPPAQGAPPLASDIAAGLSALRTALADCHDKPDFDGKPPKLRQGERWPVLPADEALRYGIPYREVLRQGVLEALRDSLAAGIYLRIRGPAGREPVCWYGQQDAAWIAYGDIWRRLGLAHYPADVERHFDAWAALARSAGWWWPGERVCVVAERPAVLRTEPVPGALHGQVRAVTVQYRDGWRPGLGAA